MSDNMTMDGHDLRECDECGSMNTEWDDPVFDPECCSPPSVEGDSVVVELNRYCRDCGVGYCVALKFPVDQAYRLKWPR